MTNSSIPTQPGYYTDKHGDLWELRDGKWYRMKAAIGAEGFAPFTSVTFVPTETWERLRVLDPEDKRDRVDRNGDVWHLMPYDKWETSNDRACFGISTLHRYYGPLHFVDEVTSDVEA